MIFQLAVAGIGIWLMASPAVLGFVHTAAAGNCYVVGPLVASFAVMAIWEVLRALRFVNVVLGPWLVVSIPFFDQPMAALGNSLLAGAAIGFLSLPQGRVTSRYAGGWRALLHPDELS